MSGGGGSKTPAYQPVQQEQVQIQPVPQTQLQTQGYGGMGYTQVPQTYTQESAPSWMKGGTMDLGGQGYQGMGGTSGKAPGQASTPNWYQMPSWGTDAVTGQALTQEQLQPAAYEPPQQPAAAPQGTNYTPQPAGSNWMDQYKAGVMNREDATRMLRYQGFDPVQAERRLNMTVRHPLARRDRWGNNDVG